MISWLVVLAVLVWHQISFFTPTATMIILPVMGLCLVAPLALMPICERYPVQSSRVERMIWNLLLVYIVLSFFQFFVPPGLVSFGVILFVFFLFGWGFWFYSSPAVVTNRRYVTLEARWHEQAEASLVAEVEANQRELDELDRRQDS